jgi:hypothetical protein
MFDEIFPESVRYSSCKSFHRPQCRRRALGQICTGDIESSPTDVYCLPDWLDCRYFSASFLKACIESALADIL